MAHQDSKKARAAKAKRAKKQQQETSEERSKKLAARNERQAQKAKQAAAAARREKLQKYGFNVALLFGVAIFGWFVFRPGPELEGVERPNNDGRGHVTNATYTSAAPTSGPHRAQAPNCGVYTSQVPLDLAVHALEHGTVILWYQPQSPELAEQLIDLTSEWDSHVIISPNPGIDAPVVATAWNRRMTFDEVTPTVNEFVDVYRNRGPEAVLCDL